tara:strand:- start:1445 stop:2083 length:639 start_codon:yes stop_codon:yes gene_type:complete
MCGRYQLITEFVKLPDLLKKNIPRGLSQRYEKQALITPGSPILVLKNEGKTQTSIMHWGFIPEWSKDPFNNKIPKPFNARSESVEEKKLFRGSWKHKRCLMPASGFLEKGHVISRKDSHTFWLGGLWNRWMSKDGSEIESCCVLTTEPNDLVKNFHNRMPVIIPQGLEEEWISSIKNQQELKAIKKLMTQWDPDQWKAEPINKNITNQLSLI